MLNLTKEQVFRFKNSFEKNKNGCWEWTGSIVKDRGGYGRFHANGKSHRAHRVSWLIYRKEWPGKMFVCHKCDNVKCVNPRHLFLGTTQDNMDDMVKKGRSPNSSGENHPSHILKEDDILNIRKSYNDGVSQGDLHRKYNVSRASICSIVQRKSWKHI